jgi:hypothetical protein
MGGPGSGRHWRWDKKTTVEECIGLDINKLVRDRLLYTGIHTVGSLTWTNTATGEEVSSCGYEVNTLDLSFSWMRLVYTFTRTGEKLDYTIKLETTSPYFEGHRWWFSCPLVVNGKPCDRRVGKLYLPPGGRYYGCRHCHDLTYTSCQESHKFDTLYASLAEGIPGVTPEDVKRVLSRRIS